MDAIETRAAQWILQRDRAKLSPDQRAALEKWLAEDSRHREAYLKLDELWRASAGLKTFRPASGRVDFNVLPAGASASSSPRRRWTLGIQIAATLLVGALAISWFLWNSSGQYVTAVGGYQRILLDDGSVIQLNTNSRVRVRYSAERRAVYLDRGEAYFEVAHNTARPFVVEADDRRIVAVGTQFSVRKEADRIRVSVTDGTVRLESPDLPNAVVGAEGAGEDLLPAGSVAETGTHGSIQIARSSVSEVEQQLAWRGGLLIFKNRPMSEVVDEFNRYNVRQIHIGNPDLSAVRIGGSFKPNDLASFLAALQALNIRVVESAATVEMYRP